MPKPVPIPVRRKLLQRAQRGEAATTLAARFGLPARTVGHLLKRFRDRGEGAVRPDYRASPRLPHVYAAEIREAALAQRREHPTCGAELIRVALGVRRPERGWPTARTLRRWSRAAGLGPAPSGRQPTSPRSRAEAPHQTWQRDASERIPLRDGQQVCWLRVVGQASGAVLRTAVFPPSLLESGRAPCHPGRAAGDVPAVGLAPATAGGQRHAPGLARRSADGLGLLVGGPGRQRGPQPAAAPPGQRRGGTVPGGRQGVGGAPELHLGGPTGGAIGGTGPLAEGARSDAYRAVALAGVSRIEALGTYLHGGLGGQDLGRAPGLAAIGVVRGASAGRSAGEGLALRST
jgi:hypothetical protein